MHNHLLRFTDEASAKAALPDFAPEGEWRGDCVIAGQSIVLARATHDSDGNELTPEVRVLGYFVTVLLPALSEALRDMPGNVCRLIGVAETGQLVYVAPDVDPAALASAIVEPMPMGAAYNFGPA